MRRRISDVWRTNQANKHARCFPPCLHHAATAASLQLGCVNEGYPNTWQVATQELTRAAPLSRKPKKHRDGQHKHGQHKHKHAAPPPDT